MLRASRRGLADLIVMIVMIVFLLGMGALAFFAYDKQQAERQYVSRLRQVPARQTAEIDATRVRYAEVCSYIGFKGEADYSSPEAIKAMLKLGAETVPDYFEITATNPDEKGAVSGTKNVARKIGDKTVSTGVVNSTRQNTKNVWEYTDSLTLHRAIGYQDEVITQMVGTHIPKIRLQREKQREFRTAAALDRQTQVNEAYAANKSRIEASDRAIADKNQEASAKETELGEAAVAEYEAYARLDSPEVRASRDGAFAKLRDTAAARQKAIDKQRQYRLKADARRLDDSRDPDGYVFLVDQKSGWVWINIGQRSDVRLNQTFQVLRADASRNSELPIGEIRVKEILEGNVARCRVDAQDDLRVYPAAGDIIKNPSFTARQYRVFALVGKFGGSHTQHTRQELVEMLLGLGFRVVSNIDGATDAVIIGGDWAEDARFKTAKETDQLNFETYTEEEVLYFLGFSGPDPRQK
ncbi:MAG: BRCT domain-containing protein [Planctomycetes bacterium]|nr:BRCT domain-containing protein [Planctomycetota bacterium]